jgi:hypothetical protein
MGMGNSLKYRCAWPRQRNPHPSEFSCWEIHRTTASCDKDPITGFRVKFSSRAMAQ